MASDLTRFATALAAELGWTATPARPEGHTLWGFGTRLHEALDKASEAALLTTPGGTEFVIVPRTDPDAHRYLVGPLRPTDLPDNTAAAIREPTVVLLNTASTPEHAAGRFSMFLSGWEDHLVRARAALEPSEAARLDHAFTAYAGTVTATLPGAWTTTSLNLDSFAHWRLFHTLWSTGSDTGRKVSASAARAALLTGPRHRVLLVQDAGPYRDTTAFTFLPARLHLTPDSPVPGPAPLPVTADANASAQSIRSLLLPAARLGPRGLLRPDRCPRPRHRRAAAGPHTQRLRPACPRLGVPAVPRRLHAPRPPRRPDNCRRHRPDPPRDRSHRRRGARPRRSRRAPLPAGPSRRPPTGAPPR
nr:hypothetical protein [Streptomyces acidiscabies]